MIIRIMKMRIIKIIIQEILKSMMKETKKIVMMQYMERVIEGKKKIFEAMKKVIEGIQKKRIRETNKKVMVIMIWMKEFRCSSSLVL